MSKLLSQTAAAEYLGVSDTTLTRWRKSGDAPPHLMVGTKVKYTTDAIDKWLDASTVPTGASSSSAGANGRTTIRRVRQ